MKHKFSVTKEQFVTIFFGVILQVYLLYPWIRTAAGNYNVCTFLAGAWKEGGFADFFNKCFPKGTELMPETALGVLTGFCGMLFAIMLVEQILILSAVVCSFFKTAPRILSSVSSILTVFMCIAWSSDVLNHGGASNADVVSKFVFGYPFLMIPITGLWFMSIRIMGEWDEASKRAQEERIARKAYRKERKRRLKFPGRYCRFHYRILWKNLWYNRKDYLFLLLSGTLSMLFLFLGVGLWNMLRCSAGGQNDYMMLSLSGTMMEFIIVIIIITFLLLMLVLTFYRKKRLSGNGLFEILGVRSNVLFVSWMTEMGIAFLFAVAAGLMLGNLLLKIIRAGIEKVLPGLGALPMPEVEMYVLSAGIMLVLSLFAYGCAHDLHAMQRSVDGRAAAVRQEPMPGRYWRIGLAGGVFLMVVSLYFFQQRRMAESIYLVSLFSFGTYLVIRNGWGIYLERKKRDVRRYLRDLTKEQMIRYRFQTTVKYMTLFLILDVCIMFFFSMRVASNQTAEAVENIYPYDYVCLANDADETDSELFERFRTECDAEIISFPMMRVTTLDATSEPDDFLAIVQFQGQNIGVSESTYRELMKLAGREPQEDLNLSEDGKNIHIVYQQDEGASAKPLDWFQWVKEPFVHIGQPLFAHNPFTRRETYPIREIAGEERVLLTGAFRRGFYENIVVFSDTYFEQMKDNWKTTDIWTGESVKPEDAELEVNIHEWPDQLQLIRVSEDKLDKADEIIQLFRENHAYDEAFDPLVQSAYSKREEMR